MKRALLWLVLLAVCFGSAPDIRADAPGSALPPPSTGGLSALDPLLKKLATHRRLLIIAAHPDDEDTALLALVARGMGGEAAYLSLSRGEGGQNLIGEDLGVGLGLIRSQELNAARRLDGARQYFTRAYDFGFSKSIEETLRIWPREILLEDTVRVIRRFRPQVIVSVFSGTKRDGHGQHQAAGMIAREAFRLAGDTMVLPEFAREGLTPWQPPALYRSTRFLDREATTVVLPTGGIDAVTGRSYHQIAMASRSLHRSQDMGMLQAPGPNETRLGWVEGGAGVEGKDLFAGVDTRLRAMAAEVSDPARRRQMELRLELVEKLVEETRRQLTPTNLAATAVPLCAALEELRAARALVSKSPGSETGVAMLLDEKIAAAQSAVTAAAGITIDALADRETVPPGESVSVTVNVWNAGSQAVEVTYVDLTSPEGWLLPAAEAAVRRIEPGKLEEWKLQATVPPAKAPTVPYFLRRPLKGELYDWSDAPPFVRGEPFAPPPLSAAVVVNVAGSRVLISREVSYRFRDQAFGEIRHPLRVVPKVEVPVEPDLIVWRIGRKERARIDVTVTSNFTEPVKGHVETAVPVGWSPVDPKPFSLAKKGSRMLIEIPISPPATFLMGRSSIAISAVLENGERFAGRIRLIDYEHIAPTPAPYASAVEFSAVHLQLPKLTKVGYIRGAADRVPEALLAVGLPIEVLTSRQIDHGDLSLYDAIVVGSRAYETEPALATSNARLLDYARSGGLLIVQYQQYGFIEGGFAPEKLEMARPHDRVTDETAPVRLLEPAHPIFAIPNRIEKSDWDDWVQERGLYFAHSWSPAYKPLLAMADPGDPEQQGALLTAKIGKGHYIYTGLAFFRQLPAGVPGAYRLFANLLAWKGKGS